MLIYLQFNISLAVSKETTTNDTNKGTYATNVVSRFKIYLVEGYIMSKDREI
jgi:hypothetical protein